MSDRPTGEMAVHASGIEIWGSRPIPASDVSDSALR